MPFSGTIHLDHFLMEVWLYITKREKWSWEDKWITWNHPGIHPELSLERGPIFCLMLYVELAWTSMWMVLRISVDINKISKFPWHPQAAGPCCLFTVLAPHLATHTLSISLQPRPVPVEKASAVISQTLFAFGAGLTPDINKLFVHSGWGS